jgi:hypothetical protein
MIRILLPLAVVAVTLLGPLYSIEAKDPVLGKERMFYTTGYELVKDTIDCWRQGEYSVKGDCKPKGDLKGMMIFAAVVVSAAAGALGVLGLLPVVGRLVSAGTMLAGVIGLAALGYFAMRVIAGNGDDAALQWGMYLAGGLSLLTLISGLAGMRGR